MNTLNSDNKFTALNEEIFNEISQPGSNKNSLKQYLTKTRGLVETDAEALAENICRKLLEDRFPPITEMELMLTEDCNQRCDYCFVKGKNEFNRMPGEISRQAVDFLFTHSGTQKAVKILFFGGEPLLEFDLIREITHYAEEKAGSSGKKVNFNMTTNGTLIDEETAEFLGKHKIRFLLSIDGDCQTHDRHRRLLSNESSYQRIIENLPLMKSVQPWLGARMTVHPDTVDRIYDNVVHLAALGINQFLIGPATGLDWTDEELDIYRGEMIKVARWLKEETDAGKHFRVSSLEEKLERLGKSGDIWGCRAGRHSITVTARGDIFPCSKMVGVGGEEGIFPLGTLEEGITRIYNRLVLCGMIPVEREKCEQCAYSRYCMGGCFATNYQATGSIVRPDPFECRLKKQTIEIVRESERILGPDYFETLEGFNLNFA